LSDKNEKPIISQSSTLGGQETGQIFNHTLIGGLAPLKGKS